MFDVSDFMLYHIMNCSLYSLVSCLVSSLSSTAAPLSPLGSRSRVLAAAAEDIPGLAPGPRTHEPGNTRYLRCSLLAQTPAFLRIETEMLSVFISGTKRVRACKFVSQNSI